MDGFTRKTLALITGMVLFLLLNYFKQNDLSRFMAGLALTFAVGWDGTAREASWIGALIGAPLGLSAAFIAVRAINLFAGGEFYIPARAVLVAAPASAAVAAVAGALLAWAAAKSALRLLPLLNHIEQ